MQAIARVREGNVRGTMHVETDYYASLCESSSEDSDARSSLSGGTTATSMSSRADDVDERAESRRIAAPPAAPVGGDESEDAAETDGNVADTEGVETEGVDDTDGDAGDTDTEPAIPATQNIDGASRVIGASVIPVMQDPTFHNLYVVLGRERRSPQWVTDSDVWCDYGGSVHWHDSGVEDEYTCAAREAWEETCALLRFSENDEIPLTSYRPLEEKLRRGEYLCHLVFAQHTFEYHTFAVLVPWDPGFPRRFQHTVRALRHRNVTASPFIEAMRMLRHPAVLIRACGVMHVDAAFIEKTAAHLFSIPLLDRSLNNVGGRAHRLLRTYAIRRSFRARLRVWLQCCETIFALLGANDANNASPMPHHPARAPPLAYASAPTRARSRSRSL